MVLHSFLFSVALLIFPYESIFVQSIIFFIHETLGFLLDFFPHTLPSNKTRCVLPLEPLNTCPAYSNFPFFISFLKCILVRILSRTASYFTLSFQVIFKILL